MRMDHICVKQLSGGRGVDYGFERLLLCCLVNNSLNFFLCQIFKPDTRLHLIGADALISGDHG